MIFSSFNWIIPVIEWWLSRQLSVPVMWPIGRDFRLIIAILLPPFPSPASCLTTHHGPRPSRCLMAACYIRERRKVLPLANWIRRTLPIGHWCVGYGMATGRKHTGQPYLLPGQTQTVDSGQDWLFCTDSLQRHHNHNKHPSIHRTMVWSNRKNCVVFKTKNKLRTEFKLQ